MIDSALYDLGYAVAGQNSAMQWSLNDAILKRQITPVFKRCSEGELAAEDALDIAMDFTTVRVNNNVEILASLFNKANQEILRQFKGREFPALVQLHEIILGLNVDAEWALDEAITRKEMYPLFVRIVVGRTEVTDGVITFCDQISAKRMYYFELISVLTSQLIQEIVAANRSKEESTNGDS